MSKPTQISKAEKINRILKNTLIFLAVFLLINYLLQSCYGPEEEEFHETGNVVMTTTRTEYSRHQTVTVHVRNNTSEAIKIPDECPAEPMNVYRYEDADWVQRSVSPDLDCKETADIIINPGQEVSIPYDNWNYALFSDMGRFRIELPVEIDDEERVYSSNEFRIVKEGIFRQIANGLFYRPIYNALIFLTSVVPMNDLGLAIILLTIIIRTILLVPSHKAMKSQKRMREIQPKLDKIKEKYKGDQQKIAQETMAIWKEAKINPLGSCLPLLMQLPFLIALFYVIQSGLNPDKAFLLYGEYSDFTIQDIDVTFFGLMDLMKNNILVLPLIVGGLQFIQMYMMMGKKPKPKKGEKGSEMAMAQNVMMYVMPVMIAVFTASLPAGVGLYWGTSTVYGIAQQYFINKGKPEDTDKNEPKVKVISPKS